MPVFLAKEFHWQRSLTGYSPWGNKEWDTTGWFMPCITYHIWATTFFSRFFLRNSTCNCLSCIICISVQFSSIQLLSCIQLFVTPWTAASQASLSITNSRGLPKLMFIESVMPSNHLILCHLLHFLPSIFPSIRIFSNESVLCISWPKYWSFSFSISPSNEYSGLMLFRMDWLDFPALQGTLKSLLQHHSSKVPILQCSAFFTVQLTSIHDYWKNHSLD